MGREEQRQNEEMNRARNQFAAAVARGQVMARDRFNKPIEAGDKLMFKNVIDPVYDVIDVTPILDPRTQPGMMRIQLSVTYPVDSMGNQPHPHMVVIAKRAPMTVQPQTDNGAGDPAERQQAIDDATRQDPPGPRAVAPPSDEPPQ